MTGLHPNERPGKQKRRRAARRRKHYAKSLHDPKSGQRKTINRGRYAAYDKKVNHETE